MARITTTVDGERTDVNVTANVNRSGSLDIMLNGVIALRLTSSGWLRRMTGLGDDLGFNLTDDGRIAIKPAEGSSQGAGSGSVRRDGF